MPKIQLYTQKCIRQIFKCSMHVSNRRVKLCLCLFGFRFGFAFINTVLIFLSECKLFRVATPRTAVHDSKGELSALHCVGQR